MTTEKIIEDLISRFAKLPTVGRKSATKIVYRLLADKDRLQAKYLATAIQEAVENIHHCEVCNTLTESHICKICNNPRRMQQKSILVVSSPIDVENMEAFGVFEGTYFVLNGLISPLEGITPEQAGIPKFIELLRSQQIQNVIIGLSTSAEGEATAQIIGDICRRLHIPSQKFATGLPSGVNFSNVDPNTILNSFINRVAIEYDD
ncbi:recombination mediator RecR [Psittacicella hinzii]|uniref:Recombination protein RecR n=1 Tax=Psittacicella hinzii TaxID=2028575 RepID=A0A3A1YCJ8_9GAMM|nr:recombination mediator RecR [Psittacicella hinzii]RIY34908.1 recombination protein RecR [Psittacicella hinzii]